MNKFVIAALAVASVSSYASAIVVDGSRDAGYGSAIVVQQNATGFANSTSGTQFANGSELDAGYGIVSGGRLYLFFAGNLESNSNKLDVFIDNNSSGSNTLGTLSNNQGNFNNMSGLTFDSGFNASRWISVTNGNAGPDIFVDYGNLVTGAGNYSGQTTPGTGTLTGGNGGPTLEVTLNNTNTAGVDGGSAPNDAASVTTGIELSIALSDLGYTGGDIRVAAFINNGDHNYISNQVLGSLPSGTGNLGGNGSGGFTGNTAGVNFSQFAGNQFFTVTVPEPTTLAAVGGLGALLLRRRK